MASSQRCAAVTSNSGYLSLRPAISCSERGCVCPSSRYKQHTRDTSVRVSHRLLASFFKGRVGKNDIALTERIDPVAVKAFSILEPNLYEHTFL